MLQLLYPCNQYSPDKCLLCGGTFRNHLTLWWAKNFYTPYDRILDQVYQDGVVHAASSSRVDTRQNRKRPVQSSVQSHNTDDIDFCYHQRYVIDITRLFHGIRTKPEKTRVLQSAISQRYNQFMDDVTIESMEQRGRRNASSKQSSVKYVVPRTNADSDYFKLSVPTKVAIWLFARDMCLDAVDKLLDLEATDRERMKGGLS
jgi:hypothetical protein